LGGLEGFDCFAGLGSDFVIFAWQISKVEHNG